jgi:hypothetical protein
MSLPVTAFQVHASDNVATLVANLDAPGAITVMTPTGPATIIAREAVRSGHKVALQRMPEGSGVIKFGVTIGVASRTIEKGGWVHLHNCRSTYDERSAGLNVETGVASDTPYI